MILLTSVSARRKELMQQIGFREGIDYVRVDTAVNIDYHKSKDRLTLDEAKKKAVEVARRKIQSAVVDALELEQYDLRPEETVVVGADTVVYFSGRVLDRPLLANPKHAPKHLIEQAEDAARHMLSDLRGQDFFVVTGLVVTQGNDLRKELSCCVVTKARMKSYGNEDIERYIRTHEPLDKAGGFGIQGRGVALFEEIKGSYSNIVGLPLVKFVELLRDPLFEGRVRFRLDQADPLDVTPVIEGAPELKVVSVGDINYDLAFSKFSAGFFSTLHPPGKHVEGELYRAVGGTAVIFALRARRAGFAQYSILGVIGGDALGKSIEEDLHRQGVQTLLPADYDRRTSIALILRDEAERDTSLILTDAHQALSEADVRRAQPMIEEADVLFVSGYCLTDPKRQEAALKAMEWAKKAGQLVVLDVTVDMDKAFDFTAFTSMTRDKVDVLVAEIPTVLAWINAEEYEQNEWTFVEERIVPALQKHFTVLFLRTSMYSHEIIVSPVGILGPVELDYPKREPDERLGYADEKTSHHLYQFLSPRLLLASASPRRFALLKQIAAENKIEVLVSNHEEAYWDDEDPAKRVERLALEKAQQVLSRRQEFSPSIEIVIGADTEIVLNGKAIGQPNNEEEARQILRDLSGKTHQAITGLALIDTRSGQQVVDSVTTSVKFKRLSEDEIEKYVHSKEPIGKAGAYGIQGKGALFVEEIDGSYSNVVGLPLERLSEILDREFGIPIWDLDKVSNWSFPHRQGRVT